MFTAHVLAIQQLCAADYTPAQISGWLANKTPQNYLTAMAKGEQFLVLQVGQQVVGFASHSATEIEGFYVHPAHVGQGLASQLLQAIETTFWQHSSAPFCQIHATLTAKAFYQKHGFQPFQATTHQFRNGTVLNIWLMQKPRPA